MTSLHFVLTFLLVGALQLFATSDQKIVVVKVVDVRSGRPIANNHLLVMFSKKTDALHDRVMEARTDTNGEVSLASDLFHDYAFTQIWVDWYARCAKDINTRWLSTSSVVAAGLVVNDCDAKRLERKPGQITVGVRTETFWERMAH